MIQPSSLLLLSGKDEPTVPALNEERCWEKMYQTVSGLWMLKCSQILSFLRYIRVSNSTLGRQIKPAGHAHVNGVDPY